MRRLTNKTVIQKDNHRNISRRISYLRKKIEELKEVQKALEDTVSKEENLEEKTIISEAPEVVKEIISKPIIEDKKEEIKTIPKKEEQKDTKKDDVIDDFEKSYREFIEKLKKEMLEQEQSVEETEEYDDWDWDIT